MRRGVCEETAGTVRVRHDMKGKSGVKAKVRILLSGMFAAGLVASAVPVGARDQTYDLLIRGGTIMDGTGRPAYVGDVAVKDGHIAAIGLLEDAEATRVIEAKGWIVSPGFINTHSHASADAVATAVNMLTQGVTSEFINADGAGTSDLDAQLGKFAADGLAENLGGYAGFNAAWTEVVGQADRQPTPAEIVRMREIISSNLGHGAWGVSAGLDYKPGYFAAAEIVAQVVAAAEPWRTHFTNHDRLRPEENYSSYAGVKETVEIAGQAGLLPLATHIKSQGAEQGGAGRILSLLDASTRSGKTGTADVYPYLAGQTGLGALLLPGWALDGGRDAMLVKLRDATMRQKVAVEAERAIRLRFGIPANIRDLESGRTIADWMAEWKTGAGETVIRLLEQKERSAILTFGSEEDLVTFLRYPASAITCDCGASLEQKGHPRAYGTYPRFLGRYVRDEKLVPWEEAVRKLTGLPAQILGMRDRGLLAPGMAADVTVFDPAAVIDHASYDAPLALSSGIETVVVNGVVALFQGKPTGAKGGSVLRRDRHMPSRPLAPFAEGMVESAGEVNGSGVTARLEARLVQKPSTPFAAGSLLFESGEQRWTLAAAGIVQTAPGWSSITATMVDAAGALAPIAITIDANGAEPGAPRTIVTFQGATLVSR